MIRAGWLQERITIQKPTAGQDGAGQVTRTWSTLVSNLPAKAEEVNGGELIRGRQVSGETSVMFTIRYRSDVLVSYRVVWGTRTLGIVHVGDPYGTRNELRIEAREVVT